MFAGKLMTAAVLPAMMVFAACGGADDGSQRVSLSGDASAGSPAVAAAPMTAASTAAGGDTIVVYKTPTCGCCSDWVDHARESGFTVVTHDLNDLTPIKQELGVPAGQVSCHTAQVRGYTLEGHVPADLIRRMLDENATFRGLTVPGMPIGSPGMDGPVYGGRKDPYEVLLVKADGSASVYRRYS